MTYFLNTLKGVKEFVKHQKSKIISQNFDENNLETLDLVHYAHFVTEKYEICLFKEDSKVSTRTAEFDKHMKARNAKIRYIVTPEEKVTQAIRDLLEENDFMIHYSTMVMDYTKVHRAPKVRIISAEEEERLKDELGVRRENLEHRNYTDPILIWASAFPGDIVEMEYTSEISLSRKKYYLVG